MKTKKITFISLSGYHYFKQGGNGNSFGGAELQVYLLSSELAKNEKYQVSVLVAAEKQKKIETINNIKLIKVSSIKKNSLFKNFFSIYKALRIEKPDIIYKRGHGKSLLICALYKLLNPKVKIIYNLANILDINGQRFKGFWGKISFLAFKFVDIIIVQTQDQYNLLNQSDKKKVPTNGLIRNIYEYNEDEFKKNPEFILWVSRCVKVKRPEIFLNLVKKFPDEKFIMICPKLDIKLWQKTQKEALNYKNLQFIESIAYTKINQYFKKAKVFINTSSYEGYPNTFLQAADTGTPILSLSVNPDNLLEKYQIGIDCKNDCSLMKEALKRLIEDPSVYNRFSKNGKKYLQEIHNKNNNFNKFLNILETL